MHTSTKKRANILGIGISPINIPYTVETIESWIQNNQQNYVCVTGVHGVIESQQDEKLRSIHNHAGLVTPDGMPLVWLSRFQGFQDVDRVYGPDLMLAICEVSVNKNYRHFLYGSTPDVLECLVNNLKERFPGINIVGVHSPPFHLLSEEEEMDEKIIINSTQPDIIWVGLSTPKQEYWMAKSITKFNAKVLIGVGAAFDFHAGLKNQAPPWMQRNGLEWFFRLLSEPKRLWKRYLVNNPIFIVLILSQILGLKHYNLNNTDDHSN